MDMDTVVQFSAGRMTCEQYERERQQLRDAYGDSAREASAKRDQALALLFAKSGWTQEELAQKEDKGQPWVCYRLRFDRFLNIITGVINPDWLPNDLTEGRFRKYWEQTSGTNERERFSEIQRLMKAQLALKAENRPSIALPLREQFADGKWHAIEAIANKLDTTIEHVKSTLHDSKSVKYETKPVGKTFHYRIFSKKRMISSSELVTKLRPIIDRLTVEGKKSTTTMSPPTVAGLAGELRKLIGEWSE